MGETGYRAGAAEPAVWAAFFFVAAAVGGGSVVAGWGAGAVSEFEPESTGGFAGGCKWVRRVDLDSLAHSSCRSIYRKQFGFMRRVVSTSPGVLCAFALTCLSRFGTVYPNVRSAGRSPRCKQPPQPGPLRLSSPVTQHSTPLFRRC